MHRTRLEGIILSGDGDMRSLFKTFDWVASSIGDPRVWPEELLYLVQLMLDSGFPAAIGWGPSLTLLYNDAYIPVLGHRHPSAFGRPCEAVWNEAWPELFPILYRALAGKASYYEDMPYTLRCREGSEHAGLRLPIRRSMPPVARSPASI